MKLQVEELQQQNKSAEHQLRILEQSQTLATYDSFVRAWDLYTSEMSQICARFYWITNRVLLPDLWAEYGNGNKEVFVNRVLDYITRNSLVAFENSYVTQEGTKDLAMIRKYCATFDALLSFSDRIDPQYLQKQIVQYSKFNELNTRFLKIIN